MDLSDAGDRRGELVDSTEDASRPLFAIFMLCNHVRVVQSRSLLVHVIGADTPDVRSGGAMWLLVLRHIQPSLRLRFVFIGDAVSSLWRQWPDFCSGWDVKLESTLYQTYKGQAGFEKPDLAIAFNPGLHVDAYDWKPALEVLLDLGVPAAITSRDSEELKDLDVLRSVGANVTQQPVKNPFASLLPKFRFDRESLFESDNAFYMCFQGRAASTSRPAASSSSVIAEQPRSRKLAHGAAHVEDEGAPPKILRKTRTVWSSEESEHVRRGCELYGKDWEKIRRELNLQHTALEIETKWKNMKHAGKL